MLYNAYEMQRSMLAGASALANIGAGWMQNPVGYEFNPDTGRAEGEIVEEVRRGYRLRDRVIRPALVAVAAEGAEETAAPEPTNREPRSPYTN